ncbi:MAG: rhomboid family intramembrane serine protease, partial [Gammaproteobacteria bacterium]
MLIVPLHRGLSRANFPVVTLALIVVNCFVYFFLQSSDARVEQHAADYYHEAGLERIEFPAFEKWLATHAKDEWMRKAMREVPPEFKLRLL